MTFAHVYICKIIHMKKLRHCHPTYRTISNSTRVFSLLVFQEMVSDSTSSSLVSHRRRVHNRQTSSFGVDFLLP